MRLDVAGHEVYAYTGTRPFDNALATVLFVHGAANDHSVFALYKGEGCDVPGPPGGLGIGRYFRLDELEPCDPPW